MVIYTLCASFHAAPTVILLRKPPPNIIFNKPPDVHTSIPQAQRLNLASISLETTPSWCVKPKPERTPDINALVVAWDCRINIREQKNNVTKPEIFKTETLMLAL
jgi:hypothetical protein